MLVHRIRPWFQTVEIGLESASRQNPEIMAAFAAGRAGVLSVVVPALDVTIPVHQDQRLADA